MKNNLKTTAYTFLVQTACFSILLFIMFGVYVAVFFSPVVGLIATIYFSNKELNSLKEIWRVSDQLSTQETGEHHYGCVVPPEGFKDYQLNLSPHGLPILSPEAIGEIKKKTWVGRYGWPLAFSFLGFLAIVAFILTEQYDPDYAIIENLFVSMLLALFISLFTVIPFAFVFLPRGSDKLQKMLEINRLVEGTLEPTFEKLKERIKATKTMKEYGLEFILKSSPKLVFSLKPKVEYVERKNLLGMRRYKRETNLVFEAAAPVSNRTCDDLPEMFNTAGFSFAPIHSSPLSVMEQNGRHRMYFGVRFEQSKGPDALLDLIRFVEKAYFALK